MEHKVSVVMTTYNGEQYIQAQLDSLRKQTYVPDEVIIRDDVSTDNTVKIIRSYIKKYNLKNWKLNINSYNLGWKQNFWKIIHEATYELIFLCDQDDIWFLDKIKDMRKIMLDHSEIELLTSKYLNFEKKSPDSDTMENAISKFSTFSKIEFTRSFLNVKSPGCCFCIRKSLVEYSDAIWTANQPHDFALLCSAILKESAFFYNKDLIFWRVHQDSADYSDRHRVKRFLQSPDNTFIKYYREKTSYLKFNFRFLEKVKCNVIVDDKKGEIVNDVYRCYKNRILYINDPNLLLALKSILKYKKVYTLKSVIGDLYLVIYGLFLRI